MSGSVQPYDLATPAPLPREAGRRLAAHRETLAEEMRIHLRRLLRLRTEVMVESPEVGRVRNLAGFEGGKAWWFAGGGKADPAGHTVLLGCAPSLVYAAIDRQLGGGGTAVASGKPPTAIEHELGMRFMRDVFQGLASAMALEPLHLEVAPHRALTEPLLTFMPDLEAPFARIAWRAKIFEQEHALMLCISRRLLEAAEPRGDELTLGATAVSGPVAGAPIELLVELARCQLTVEESAALAPGDVVLFDQPPGEPIEIRVQGKPRFHGRLGTHTGRYAIEVTAVVETPASKSAAVAAGARGGAGVGTTAGANAATGAVNSAVKSATTISPTNAATNLAAGGKAAAPPAKLGPPPSVTARTKARSS